MTIKLYTLKTNHTLLGEIVNENAISVTIKFPVQVVMQPTREGNVLGFSPFVEYSEEFKTGINILKSDILTTTTPIRELENQYNQIFGSGIEIASAIPKL